MAGVRKWMHSATKDRLKTNVCRSAVQSTDRRAFSDYRGQQLMLQAAEYAVCHQKLSPKLKTVDASESMPRRLPSHCGYAC